MTPPLPGFLHDLVGQLRRRGLQIGVDDLLDLRRALGAGFGLGSDTALRQVCVALWAKSTAEAEIVNAAFARVDVPEWSSPRPGGDPQDAGDRASPDPVEAVTPSAAEPDLEAPATRRMSGLVHPPPRTGRRDNSLILAPQYPTSDREIIQVWRALRRPVRQGPPVEMDVDATLARRAGTGLRTPPVMVAARRNSTRLLLLVDRQGSMTPFHDYVEHIRQAMERAGRFDTFTVGYFHNTAGHSHSHSVLADLPDPFSPALDPVLGRIEPLVGGLVYSDPSLSSPLDLDDVLASVTRTTSTVIVSDAGAARGGLHTPRLVDTVALAKALLAATGGLVWLNPLRRERWRRTTAGQIARHVPMFPLTRQGMYRAVNVLRGRPLLLDRPL